MYYTHTITLHRRFQDPINRGEMTAVTVPNSMAIQRGDCIKFELCDNMGITMVNSELENDAFEVTFVYGSGGMADGYSMVCFRKLPF